MDIIVAYYCSAKSYDTKSLVFWNDHGDYRTDHVTAFDTHGPMGCTAADFDNDGVKEIVFCNTMRGPSQYDPAFPVFAYYGTPDHQYKPENRRDYPVKYGSNAYAVADVDNDGYVELLATHANGVRIFKGTPNGPDPSKYRDLIHTPDTIVGVGSVLVGDFNRDGWLDVIMAPWMYGNSEKELQNSVFLYYGGPDGYSDQRRMVLPAYVECANAVQLADINHDGYVDFLYGDKGGFIGVYYGGPDGFSRKRFGKIPLKNYNGANIMGITVGDIDKDGRLELFVTTAGHYTRRVSHLYILRDADNNFPIDRQFMFETGGTTGFPELADLRKNGSRDLLLPFYSTHESRELPARIFWGDGKGDFDWKNPLIIDRLASIAFFPVDLTGNGYPDVFICCHRNNLGHIVDSKLIMNGPNGLDIENTQDILGYGAHCFTNKSQAISLDKSDKEYYTSPVFECKNPRRIEWTGQTPFKTSLSFRLRFGDTEAATLKSNWSERITASGSPIQVPVGTKYMQYQAAFNAPGLVNSPRLMSVAIECE